MCKIPMSKTQIDRLGDRLKGGPHTDTDLGLLDDYRRSFGEAYEAVVHTIRQQGEFPTGRLAKSTPSIVEKLRRESLRLSQMQDIAGCRVVVGNIMEQDQFVAFLLSAFPNVSAIDRRNKPSYGYRAVHIIVVITGKPVEIQVRTTLQHLWAEVSEKSSDVLDPTIKYGGGSEPLRNFLKSSSVWLARYENFEKEYCIFVTSRQRADAAYESSENEFTKLAGHHVPDHQIQELRINLETLAREKRLLEMQDQEMQRNLEQLSNEITQRLTWVHSSLVKLGRQIQ
jgi:putative GTP pyrophosphokinase